MIQETEQAIFVEHDHCINCGSKGLFELSGGKYTDHPLAKFLVDDPGSDNCFPHLQTARWKLATCKACGQVFHRHILNEAWNERRFTEWMTADSIREFEASLGPPFARHFNTASHHIEHVLRIERLTRGIRADDAVRVLDFGCGFGGFVEACNHFGFRAIGVDRSIGRRSGCAIEIYPSLDALGDQKFHAITLFEVLEHLDQPSETLRLLSTFLLPEGILVLETPDCTGVTGIQTRSDYLKVHPLEHINVFTHKTLRSIAERNGFEFLPRGPAFVTAEGSRVTRRLTKHMLGKDGKSTQIYFRKATPH